MESEIYYYRRRAIEAEDAFHNIRYQYQNLRAELEKEKEKTTDLHNIISRLMSELSFSSKHFSAPTVFGEDPEFDSLVGTIFYFVYDTLHRLGPQS